MKEYYDPNLKLWVTSARQVDRVAKERGLVNANDWESPDALSDEAERNRRDTMHKTYRGYDEAVAKALYRAERGEEFEKELAHGIRQADSENEKGRIKLFEEELEEREKEKEKNGG